MSTETRQTFPSYSELTPEQQASPEYLTQHHENPPTIRMKLEDATREAEKTRGVYELSMPTIDTERCFAKGKKSCQWLGREPDWRKGHRSSQDCPLYLYEVTPLEDERGFFNLRWLVEIVGEAEQRAVYAARFLTRCAVKDRLELAG